MSRDTCHHIGDAQIPIGFKDDYEMYLTSKLSLGRERKGYR